MVLRAKADWLESAEVKFQVEAVVSNPSVAIAQPVFHLQKWRMSPVTATAPNPKQKNADSDQNSWQQIKPGRLQPFADDSFAVYRIKFKPLATVQQNGGRIVFKSVTGKAEAGVDKKTAPSCRSGAMENQPAHFRWRRNHSSANPPVPASATVAGSGTGL